MANINLHNNYRLSYAKHLTELIEIIGNDGVKNLAKIFENFMVLIFPDFKILFS